MRFYNVDLVIKTSKINFTFKNNIFIIILKKEEKNNEI